MRILLGGDEDDPLLAVVMSELAAGGHEVRNVGATAHAARPWAEVALAIGRAVASHSAERGIVCCYTGTGVAMAANKVHGVRAALCVDAETARGARQWNDANVLALSFRLTSAHVAREIVRAFLTTPYGETEATSLAAVHAAEREPPPTS